MLFPSVLLMITMFLSQAPQNPIALVQSAQARFAQAGSLAARGEFGPASEMIQEAMAEMDRAVSLAPNEIQVRLARGLAYSAFPKFYEKAAVAREDLETAMHDPTFQDLSVEQRARVTQALARVTESDVHVDRFPNISADTSPLVVVLSITFSEAFAAPMRPRMAEISQAVEGFQGLLGKHLVESMDKPGMFIIFTWWKDKHAASEFYYSSLHQSWMRARGQTIAGASPMPPPEAIPTQVGVDVFADLPGGEQINGGFIPSELFTGRTPGTR